MTSTEQAPLNILMIAPQFRPIIGGYEKAAEHLSTALVEKDHKVTVVTERRDKAWARRETFRGIQIQRLSCLYRPRLHLLTSLLSFAVFLMQNGRRFDVWHVHQYGAHAALAIAVGRLLSRPVVLKLTSSGERSISRAVASTRFPKAFGYLIRRVSAVVAVSKQTSSEAVEFGISKDKVMQLGNGVFTNRFHPCDANQKSDLKKSLNLKSNGTVLYVGRMSEEKRPQDLLEAWSQAAPNMPDGWKLVFVGDGPLTKQLENEAAALGIKDTVMFAGFQDNVHSWMQAADIYALTSLREGLPNTMLEAMATGLPVVSTRVSGATDLVESTGAGYIVDVGDCAAIGEKIVELAASPEARQQHGQAAKHVIDQFYAVSIVAERHIELYHRLACARSSGAGSNS